MDIRLLELWQDAKVDLDQAKKEELRLRRQICSQILGSTIEGTVHHKEHGFDIAASAKLNKTLDPEFLDAIWNDLSQAEQDAIKFKPTLVAKQYKTLDVQSKLHQAVTAEPGTPTLKIKPI